MRHRKMWLTIRAIAMLLAAIAAPGLAGAQIAPPPTCPVTDSNVKVIRVPHREVVVMPMSSDGPTQDDIQIFTSVPAGMNFHVTHIGGRFTSSAATGSALNSYEVELLIPGSPLTFLAAMVPDDGFWLAASTHVRTLNLPWDANYLNDGTTYEARVHRATNRTASTARLIFDGYLEPGCTIPEPPR